MKKLALPLLLITAAALAQAPASDAGLSGKWKLHQSIAGNDSDSECTFTQKDADLTGSCGAGDQGTVKLTGKVDGKKVSWSYKSEYNGSPLTMNYSGTLDSAKITGEVEVDPFSVTGDFTATQAK
jgi:hypothetical protein